MLNRTDYESWSQRIRLYYRGKENRLQILQSIDQGPFELGTTRDTLGTTPEGGVLLGPERPHTYEDLVTRRRTIHVRCPYHTILFRAHKKKTRESQLYDEFERFKMLPGENINEYYVRFHKLVNDMRNIRMTMPNIQLNSKFINNTSPKWDRFVTAVKLNKGLKETNHEQLYAYLKQHEKHAEQDQLIIKRITPAINDQLAFVSMFGINKWYQSFALRNFDLKDMELESTNSGPTTKLPLLKLENDDSWVSVPQTSQENGITVTKILPPEWNTHVVVWMTKPEVETMSIDDLYNNFKIVEPKVKETVSTSSSSQNLAFMTAPSSSSTNDANTAYSQVSAASPSVNTASPQVCTASVSDNTVYAFMVENPNGSNVLHQDLEQIHEDDLEAMDLKWQLSLLSVRAKKYYQKTGKKIFINGNDIAGYDKSKVECYNCHKLGHFARECRASRSKEDQFRNQDNTRKQGNKEDTSKAMLAIDGVGFDWSDMAEEQVQTNMALMAFSDSEVYTDKTCSKTCLNNYETLKKQYDDLLAKQLQTKFESATYKRGLDTVEAQLVTYRKNEVLFSEEVTVLKREVGIKQYEINTLKTEFAKLKQEKDAIDFKIEKFDKASKDLDQLLGSQITDKSKKGFGYSAVPPPHPLIYNRPNKLDLSYSGLDEFKEPEFKGYGPENSKKESNVVKESDNSKENSDKSLVKEQESQVKSSFVEGCGSNTSKRVSEGEPKKVRENNDAPIIEDWVSDDEEQDESMTKPVKKTVIPTAAKIEKPVKKSVRYAEMYRSQRPRGNQRNWNGQKSNQLVNTARTYRTPINTVRPRIVNTARTYRTSINTVRPRVVNTTKQNRTSVNAARINGFNAGKPQHNDKGFVDSGCSRHMTGNIAYLSDLR
ncbi:ribonuclease H-like domain-containing protein [Tanacetum coccineum]